MVTLATTVKDIMDRNIVTADVKTSVFDAVNLMLKNKVWSLVVTEKGDYVGLITERDIIRRCIALGLDYKNTPVEKMMSSPLHTIEAHRSPAEAMQKMTVKNVRRLLVTESGKIVGRVTQTGLLRKVHELLLSLAETTSML